MQRIRRVAGLAIFLCSFAFAAGLDTSKLKPTGYVNDFAHVIDAGAAAQIEAYCGNVERATGAQFAIVTVETLDDEPVEDVAVRLFKEWGIGKKGTDEGLLVLLAIKDRKNRVEVGYGLEPIITDADAGAVLRGIRPILRQGNYGGALLAAAQQLGQRVAQAKGVTIEGQPVRQRRSRDSEGGGGGFFGIIIFFVILMFIFRALSGRGGRGGPGGGGSGMGGLLTGMILGNMMGGGRRGGDWGGGGFGGGGWGGGGGGGFGGFGGGSSGGGGASGGW
ncbi:MAG: TPM domain-containing protein [Acidobacteriia bacterium]|nr:TPM domain-containing protein [Terriglobia bacterium]